MALPIFPENGTATPRRRDLYARGDEFALLYRDERWWTDKLISGAWIVFIGSIALALCITPIQDAQELAKRVGAIDRGREREFRMYHEHIAIPAQGD